MEESNLYKDLSNLQKLKRNVKFKLNNVNKSSKKEQKQDEENPSVDINTIKPNQSCPLMRQITKKSDEFKFIERMRKQIYPVTSKKKNKSHHHHEQAHNICNSPINDRYQDIEGLIDPLSFNESKKKRHSSIKNKRIEDNYNIVIDSSNKIKQISRIVYGKDGNDSNIGHNNRSPRRMKHNLRIRFSNDIHININNDYIEIGNLNERKYIKRKKNSNHKSGKLKLPNIYANQLPERTIDNLNQIKNSEYKQCGICLENYQLNEKVTTLPCFHFFHKSCLLNWFKNKKECPLCKYKIN